MSAAEKLRAQLRFNLRLMTRGRSKNHGVVPEEFFLKHGHFYKQEPLTPAELDSLKTAIVSRLWTAGDCYKNAGMLAIDHGLSYCEGYATRAGVPVSHAWISIGDKPVDVTWPINEKDVPSRSFKRIVNRIQHNTQHAYLGVEVPREHLGKHLMATGRYCPLAESPALAALQMDLPKTAKKRRA